MYIFIAMHSCIHIALHVQEEAILVLNHLNDTVYEVFNISYHKVTDYLNTHNEIILNNINVYLHPEVCTVVHKLPHSFCCIISHTRSEHLTQFLKIYTPCGDAKLWLNFS